MSNGLATGGKVWKVPMQSKTTSAKARSIFTTPEPSLLIMILSTGLTFGIYSFVQELKIAPLPFMQIIMPENSQNSAATGYVPYSAPSLPILVLMIVSTLIAGTTMAILFIGKQPSWKKFFVALITALVIAFTGSLLLVKAPTENTPKTFMNVSEWAHQRYGFSLDNVNENFDNNGNKLYSGLLVKDNSHKTFAEFKFVDNQYYLYDPFIDKEIPTKPITSGDK